MTPRDRKKLLKMVWSQLSALEGQIDEYMECAVVWLEFLCVLVYVYIKKQKYHKNDNTLRVWNLH